MGRYKVVVHNISFGEYERVPVIIQNSKTHSLALEGLLSVVVADPGCFDMILDCSPSIMHSLENLSAENIVALLNAQAETPIVTHHILGTEKMTLMSAVSAAASIVVSTAASDLEMSIGTDAADMDVLLIMRPGNIVQTISTPLLQTETILYGDAYDALKIDTGETLSMIKSFASVDELLTLKSNPPVLSFPINFDGDNLSGFGLSIAASISEAVVHRIYFLFDWSDYDLADLAEMDLANLYRSEVIE